MALFTITNLFSLLFGLALGSFLNVCIHRIPLKKSIVHPPSSCPQCGQKIRFYDNIPVISYIALLGRCRNCKAPISPRYPVVEIITGLLSTALFLKYGLDYRYFILGLAFSIIFHHISWLESVIGVLGGGGSLFLVAVVFEKLTGREGMGGGDVKLLAMIGAWMGWRALPLIILISSLTGTIIGGGSLLLASRGLQTKIPFGPFLVLGALIYLFFGNELVSWYSRILLR
jgi:leader peptidase (prepilin peptidase)/N-methyltransferase